MGVAKADAASKNVDWRGFVESYLDTMDPEHLENLVEEVWRLEGYDEVLSVEGDALDLVATKQTPVPVRSVVRIVERAGSVEARETARAAEEFGNVTDAVVISRRPTEECEEEAGARGVDVLDTRALASFLVSRRYHWPLFRWLLRSTRSGYRTVGEVSSAPVEFAEVGEGRGLVGKNLAVEAGLGRREVIEVLGDGGVPVSVDRRGALSLKRDRLTLDHSLRDRVDVEADGSVRFDRVEAQVADRIQVVCTHEILETQRLQDFFTGDVVYRSLEKEVPLADADWNARAMVVEVDPGTICTVDEDTTFHQLSFRQVKNRLS